jgi:hypothetical protein
MTRAVGDVQPTLLGRGEINGEVGRTDNLRRLTRIIGSLVILLVCVSVAHAQPGSILEVGKFSAGREGESVPDGWKPLTFPKIPRYTKYTLVIDNGTVAVKAVSESASSGLTRKININPREYPIVQWRWKVENVLSKGDVFRKEGDDHPARLYITFEYDARKVGFFEKAGREAYRMIYGQQLPLGAINYIWESKAPVGTVAPSPYTKQSMMFVVESGKEKLNAWVSEERNVYEDYKKAFGDEPSMINGVAIMTDTDNTRETATAYYGDIVFKKAAN